MREKRRKLVTWSMIVYELRNVTGNPFIHIFGVGMPVLMSILIARTAVEQMGTAMARTVQTSVFLGIGVLIPMATILMGYSVMQAQDLERGIPVRLQLFGIRSSVTICSRIISQMIFMAAAFLVYFAVGASALELEAPSVSGAMVYGVCLVVFSVICFMMAHAIAALIKKFSITYCVVMILYFACMILGGMMGVSYENLSSPLKAAARLLPVTYFNRDFYTIWIGDSYRFGPMLQSYLFFGAMAGILLFIALKRERVRK